MDWSIIMACIGSAIAGGVMVFTAVCFGKVARLNEHYDCSKFDCIYHPDNEGAGYLRYREGEE